MISYLIAILLIYGLSLPAWLYGLVLVIGTYHFLRS